MRKARNGHFELARKVTAGSRPSQEEDMSADADALRSRATTLARNLAWIPAQRQSQDFAPRCHALFQEFQSLLAALENPPGKDVSDDFGRLQESRFLLEGELQEICPAFKLPRRTPQVRTPAGAVISRVAALAEGFLASINFQFSEESFAAYVQGFQEITVLKMSELWMLIPVMKFRLLEEIGRRGPVLLRDPNASVGIEQLVDSLQAIKQTSWKCVIGPLILFDRILQDDPAAAYFGMDYESRDLYRRIVVNIAEWSDANEMKVAREVLELAQNAHKRSNSNPRITARESHVGFYLVAEGRTQLEKKLGCQPPFAERLRALLRKFPNEFYLPGIAVLTCAIVSVAVLLLTQPSTPLPLILLALLAVLLPASQSAVQIMNSLVTSLLPAQILPKLDFSDGLPDDCVTVVAIPTMLLNEKQVHKLVDDLEVRYFGNQDPNLHFALLTDLPDSSFEPNEDNPLIDLAAELIRKLNQKYAPEGMGTFFLLHRHRVYNPQERLWMGWERKRGKLMDLNNLLYGTFDSFPVKVGDFSILSAARFIITLDSDTELPRQSAKRLVGTLAHPLNQAIIDPEKGIVVEGYGILQPRTGVSVQSTARSRLATIYSGQTGLDIYTHATSDVYQDLYGEGIFVGKGIYEAKTLHRVLHGRFPRNALLSHDLIEGAYARAGLASDIELIEDYPSHYSAHNRRKHRWLRGDWQITEWLLSMVPEESGQRVANPLSIVSRWKILDNLRRSLVEPALFILFLLAWTCLPGSALIWTLAAIVILFLPALCQFAVDFARSIVGGRRALINSFDGLLNAGIANLLTVTFLAHQALLSMDAVVRTMVRRLITREKLLEWETAAEAELAGEKRTMLDIYLNWTPALAFGVFFLVWFVNRDAVLAALPILFLWALSKPISLWLNRPPRAPRKQVSESNRWLLRVAGLRTWRYFAQFSTQEHHWLIPDNVQKQNPESDLNIAPRVSPTNLGLLLNVRQVACEFGYLTVPQFAEQTLRTLSTMARLRRHRGHFLNWYDTHSLDSLPPALISSVDSGNLVASLWALQQGCLDLFERPLFPPELAEGLLDHLYVLANLGALPRRRFSAAEKAFRRSDWLQRLPAIREAFLKSASVRNEKHAHEAKWFREQAESWMEQVSHSTRIYAPWLLPEFAALHDDPAIYPDKREDKSLARLTAFIDNLERRLRVAVGSLEGLGERSVLYQKLLAMLPEARAHVIALIADLTKISDQARQLADEMDFGFLLNRQRGLLSIGFDADKRELHTACYDLLGSEARIAYFVAIAKGEVPQESWFLLGRAPTTDSKTPGLLSWTGTMFEYLMPALWMRIYPNTLLERATTAAVRLQREYAAARRVPWGISESSSSRLDASGNYSYFAFGVPDLAIHKPEASDPGPVISPYSTFLALHVDPQNALRNLRQMQHKHWQGDYGFYEAVDFTPGQSRSRGGEVVHCWMAHHQGMSFISIANFLEKEIVQRWFHSDPRVQATELLLQEKPAALGIPAIPRKPRAEVA